MWLLDRRHFLTVSGGVLVGLGALGTAGCRAAGRPATPEGVAQPSVPARPGRSLVVIFLAGGNDGLNTVAPYGLGRYYDLRPTLGIKESEALPLTDKLGLHPNLAGMKRLFDSGKLTIVQGVGYPNPDRSHFRSMDIWATAQTKGVSPVGWLGRYLDQSPDRTANPLRALAIGGSVPKPLIGQGDAAIAIENMDTFLVRGAAPTTAAIRQMYDLGAGPLAVVRGRGETAFHAADAVQKLAGTYTEGATYPAQNGLATSLQLIVRLLAGGAGAQVLYTTFGGFDEHANEKKGHDNLMKQLDDAVTAYQADLEAHGLADRVITLVHSEFGRRAKENASGGTDHGAAAPTFLIGTQVKGGFYGDHPSLTDLEDGDLKMGIDFRSIYATMLDRWFDGPADSVLGGKYERLDLLKI